VGSGIALFQGDEGDRMVFPIDVPETDRYVVQLRHYLSPGYGSARVYLDGEPLGEPFSGHAATLGQAQPRDLATMELEAGEHEVAVELIEPIAEGNNYWMGLTGVALQPADREAELVAEDRIERVERTDLGEGAVGVRVVGEDGVEDRVFSALDADTRDYGDGYSAAARFAQVRTDANGLVSAGLIGGTSLVTPQIAFELSHDAWRAEVVEVDDAAREVVLEVDGPDLPEGDALRGEAIYFSNSEYSRNTAYHIDRVTRDGDRFRVRVRESTFLLGKAVVDGPPMDAVTMTSVVPHPYDRTMGRSAPPKELDFFGGKLITAADGSASTIVRGIATGQPITITVDSTEGFEDGMECRYHDVKPGDTATIHTRASLQRTAGDNFMVRANAALTFTETGEQIPVEAALQGVEGSMR
jgi:hypothetical protein